MLKYTRNGLFTCKRVPMSPARRSPGGLSASTGGAIYHRESIVLVNTTFQENMAGDEGVAVFGSTTATLNNVSFANNTLHCAHGQYLYDAIFGAVRIKTTEGGAPTFSLPGRSHSHERGNTSRTNTRHEICSPQRI